MALSQPVDVVNTNIDIAEREIPGEVLEILLSDRTTGKNIFWASDDYVSLGEGYAFLDEIKPELIVNNQIILPRVLKSRLQQTERSRNMAEVFTPSWICNAQNNLVDEAWFGRKDVFNVASEDGSAWTPSSGKVTFPEGKTWKDYVKDTRLEITCGEAPYLVNRYDTVSGEAIQVPQRIGILDRKLRVACENTTTPREWHRAAVLAYKSCYGYEWQGDSLLLAREAMLYSYQDYYEAKFPDESPSLKDLMEIAEIISWNLWQMDGLKCVVPCSCEAKVSYDLWGEATSEPCCGCQTDNIHSHTGKYCIIKDWHAKDAKTGKVGKEITFVSLLKNKK